MRLLEPGVSVKKKNLFLNCLRTTLEAYQHGTFDRWSSVALMATCIDIAMRTNPADDKTSPEVRDAAAVPKLELSEPLNVDDRILQELYAEATTFWAEGFGRLRLVK
jgi:hypothetical protein